MHFNQFNFLEKEEYFILYRGTIGTKKIKGLIVENYGCLIHDVLPINTSISIDVQQR